MNFFSDSQNWDGRENELHANSERHLSAHDFNLDSFDAELNDNLAGDVGNHLDGNLHDHLDTSLNGIHSYDEHNPQHQAYLPQDDQQQQQQLNEQMFSPALSFQGTPLLSPHALAPQNVHRRFSYANHTPQGTPQGTPLMGPLGNNSVYSPSSTSAAGSVTEYGMYYPSKRASGKITKHSPAVRWRAGSITGSVSEDEFRLGDPALGDPALGDPALGDPALDANNLLGEPSLGQPALGEPVLGRRTSTEGDEVEERLRNAIAATTKANSRSNSTSSLKSIPSRRTSVGSSTRTTPRIRPRVNANVSTDPSPLMRPEDTRSHDELFLKSNYQNLVDGTHQHLGLSSAERMSSDLRSKKAVHKLAEQERRNRMNSAIQELSKVLGGEEDKSSASKAATVENATRYIRKLHARLADLEAKVGGSQKVSPS